MRDLLVLVVSWNRPQFLRPTLDSLTAQFGGFDAALWIVDNGSDAETVEIIREHGAVEYFRLLGSNLGINGALEAILPDDLDSRFRAVLISDADINYCQPFWPALNALGALPKVGAVSLQHSPEHPEVGRQEWGGRVWLLKNSERGCALLLSAATLQQLRPLPVHKMVDFDWWVFRDSPNCLQKRGHKVAVLPGGAQHLGWRAGDSTWQTKETPEVEACKLASTDGQATQVTVAIVTPTIGRPTLARSFQSIRSQLQPGDEWWVVGDGPRPEAKQMVTGWNDTLVRYCEHQAGGSVYGNAQRNFAMHQSKADFFLFLDDDDVLLPGALDAIRREGVTGKPLMFRMDYRPRGCTLWEEPALRVGNVGGSMFVIPNRPGRWCDWEAGPEPCVSDFHFIKRTLALWPPDSLRWCRDVIYLVPQSGGGK